MKISINIKTGAKNAKIEKINENEFKISVKARPIENKANLEIIKILADYFNVPKSNVKITSGLSSKRKICDIISL